MPTDIKFCGLTRSQDAVYAAELGAAFVGVILAGGPRNLEPRRAADVLANVPATVRRVGVFADQNADEIARVAELARLDVVQLHGSHDPGRIEQLRRLFRGQVWRVVRVPVTLPADFQIAGLEGEPGDGLVLDAFVQGTLGGTGVALPWEGLAPQVAALRRTLSGAPVVLAGGLESGNVKRAIQAIAPDVVDVSSGVESAPGIKDHARMRVFRDAALAATVPV
ncbi:MAG: N-(5'-phosphoribosyl)anthranilate isomerase [Gemmatimonadales bacterium]